MLKHSLPGILLCLALKCFSQEAATTARPLSIGDSIPHDLVLSDVYNYPVSKIRLSDLKGKFIILDFWATWCGACIATFPKMHQLQARFGDNLQVILVNTYQGDDLKRIHDFAGKRKAKTGLPFTLPYSLFQKEISQYFSYRFIPHLVWIDPAGKIAAITSQAEATEQSVRSMIAGNPVSFHQKNDAIDINPNNPLPLDSLTVNNQLLSRSVITKYIEGLGNETGITHDDVNQTTRFHLYNAPLALLIRTAYQQLTAYSSNRIIIKTKRKNILDPESYKDTLLYSSAYCYELILPTSSFQHIHKFIQADLEKTFQIKVSTEKKLVNCYVLKATSNISKIISRNSTPVLDMEQETLNRLFINQPVSTLTDLLNNSKAFSATPLINDTGVAYNIDLPNPPLFTEMNTIEALNYLQKIGFAITLEERSIDVAVIEDTNTHEPN